jgi:hypothetical protein
MLFHSGGVSVSDGTLSIQAFQSFRLHVLIYNDVSHGIGCRNYQDSFNFRVLPLTDPPLTEFVLGFIVFMTNSVLGGNVIW